MEDQLLVFFKTFIDPLRIRIAALLLDETVSAETLAARLNCRASDMPRHLAQFEKLGLLLQDGDRYRLDGKAFERLSREVLSAMRPSIPATSNDENADEFDRKVVKNYSLPDGKLRELPLQERKFQAVLRHVVTVFQPGQHYTEKETNELLKGFHADFASLRRGLVEYKMIERTRYGSTYWRPR